MTSAVRTPPLQRPKLVITQIFAEVLGRLRQEFGFRLVGWALMPDHFHLLIQLWGADLTRKVCANPVSYYQSDAILAMHRLL